ncbi:MAG TPA: putative toxin-antitoxin system toxin component, PIN family [Bacteroidia bacterium]|nr:putative toxin-antitoxin system toxin component, PIN family [Bacteroidia bacterium]
MPRRKDRIVIDTNLWVSFLITKDYSALDDLLSEKKVVLLFSDELLAEFIDVCQRPKLKKYFSDSDLRVLLVAIRKYAEFIEVKSTIKVCRDPKDNFLLALAKDGKASHLITGDGDLLDMKRHKQTTIESFSAYLTKQR